MPDQVLVVEDDLELREMLLDALRDAGYSSTGFARADAVLRALAQGLPADVVLTDLLMPGMQGQELMARIRRERPELNVLIMTAFGSIDSAIDLVKAGAFDYLTKPLAIDDLLLAVQRALQESEHRREAAAWSRTATGSILPGFVGASGPMRALYPLIAKAARSPHPVLISGESGTGKELVARALHQASGLEAFVTVNCGALPEALLESELFGHEKGAFTGADRAKDGLFHVADGGTLFLDEIAELSLTLQPKLLRALEHSEIRRVGSTQPRTVNVRLLAATNRDLEQEVKLGRFRDDLFWRLNVLTIHVPPLRDRPGDIPLLAEHFLGRAAEEGRIPARQPGAAERAGPPFPAPVHHAGGDGAAGGVSVAGQRARASQRHPSRGHARREGRDSVGGPSGARSAGRSGDLSRGCGLPPQPHSPRAGAALHHRGAPAGRREQVARRGVARPGPEDAVPETGGISHRGSVADRVAEFLTPAAS